LYQGSRIQIWQMVHGLRSSKKKRWEESSVIKSE
jgi:hypothetical protein